MADPIRALAKDIAAVNRRLHALETAPRAPNTSVTGGRTRWFAEDGDTDYVQAGVTKAQGWPGFAVVEDASGDLATTFIGHDRTNDQTLLQVMSPDRTRFILRTVNGTMTSPLLTCAWQRTPNNGVDAVGLSTITSATYVTCWETIIACQTGSIGGAFSAGPDVGGTTVDFRVTVGDIDNYSEQTLVEQTGLAALTTVQDEWPVPESIYSPARTPVGARLLLRAKVRRAAGGGTALLAPIWPASNAS